MLLSSPACLHVTRCSLCISFKTLPTLCACELLPVARPRALLLLHRTRRPWSIFTQNWQDRAETFTCYTMIRPCHKDMYIHQSSPMHALRYTASQLTERSLYPSSNTFFLVFWCSMVVDGCRTGDGANDSSALKAADVGIR